MSGSSIILIPADLSWPTIGPRVYIPCVAIFPPVDKVRHRIRVGDHVWELDVFAGENQGLVMAEVELGSEDESFEMPEWAGDEVSSDPRYYNVNLARNPFRHW